MKQKKLTIFRRLAILIFCLVTVLGIIFSIITYLATDYYHQASTQLLNKDVAAHIAKFTSPFTDAGIDKQKADSVFNDAMILSPRAEVYFLDPAGKVICYHAQRNEIVKWMIPLEPIQKFISTGGEKYITGDNPKNKSGCEIFSAAEVREGGNLLGYIYVILGSKKSETAMGMLFESHILRLAAQAMIITILLSLLFSLLYLNKLSRNFRRMVSVLERFEDGDYSARFDTKKRNELQPVMQSFNKMADLLSASISKLQASEQERKNFIAIISHDLRTPLSIARGYTETLLLKTGEAEMSEEDKLQYYHLIYSKIMQIENMVRQLFELSKIDAVEFRPQKEPFVLSEIVQEAINNFQPVAKEKKVTLKCVQCLFHVWVNADISMMERVVQNLADNALKSTPEGGSAEASLSVENDLLIVKIENDGPPLSYDLLKWINDGGSENRFTEKRPRQLGLGLVIVQKILLLHGSSLKATRINERNVFTFALHVYQQPS